MTSPLQKSPISLLGAFDLKTLGDNPTAFGETVVPQADVIDFYLQPNLSFQLALGNLTNSGDELVLTVPVGVVWRVRAFSGRSSIGSLDTNGFIANIFVRLAAGQSNVILAENQVIPPAAGLVGTLNAVVAIGLPRPLLLQSGAVIGMQISAQFNAARASSVQGLIEVIPA